MCTNTSNKVLCTSGPHTCFPRNLFKRFYTYKSLRACGKYVRANLYVRMCTYEYVRANLYTRVCTCESVCTSLYIGVYTYGSVRARLY